MSTRSAQANAIVERDHHTIGNIIRTLNLQQLVLFNEKPWKEVSHQPCSPYGLGCTLLLSTHRHNWYLVGMGSLISTRKPTGKQLNNESKVNK